MKPYTCLANVEPIVVVIKKCSSYKHISFSALGLKVGSSCCGNSSFWSFYFENIHRTFPASLLKSQCAAAVVALQWWLVSFAFVAAHLAAEPCGSAPDDRLFGFVNSLNRRNQIEL